jgi:hypothetical protein
MDDPKQRAKDEGAVHIARHPGDNHTLLDMSTAADFHQLLDALVVEYFDDFDEPDKAKYARDQLTLWRAAAEAAVEAADKVARSLR